MFSEPERQRIERIEERVAAFGSIGQDDPNLWLTRRSQEYGAVAPD